MVYFVVAIFLFFWTLIKKKTNTSPEEMESVPIESLVDGFRFQNLPLTTIRLNICQAERGRTFKRSRVSISDGPVFHGITRGLEDDHRKCMGVSKNRGTLKWMVKIMENPIF